MTIQFPGNGTLPETATIPPGMMRVIGDDSVQTVYEFLPSPPSLDRFYPQGRKSKRGQRRARRWQ